MNKHRNIPIIYIALYYGSQSYFHYSKTSSSDYASCFPAVALIQSLVKRLSFLKWERTEDIYKRFHTFVNRTSGNQITWTAWQPYGIFFIKTKINILGIAWPVKWNCVSRRAGISGDFDHNDGASSQPLFRSCLSSSFNAFGLRWVRIPMYRFNSRA